MGARQRGIAAQIVRLTFSVGLATLVIAIAALAVTTLRLTQDRTRNRHVMVLRAVEYGVESHMTRVSTLLRQASTMGPARDLNVLRDRLRIASESSRGDLREVLLVDVDGKVLYSNRTRTASDVRSLSTYRSIRSGVEGYLVVRPAGRPWELWFARTVIGPNDDPLFLIARLETLFVQDVMDSATWGMLRRHVYLFDNNTVLATGGGSDLLALETAVWNESKRADGTVHVSTARGRAMSGRFDDFSAAEGLRWRVVVVEPASAEFLDMAGVVTPPLLVLLIGGLIGLAMTRGMAGGLVRPLKELERRARAAGSGSYVEPLDTSGNDEITRVSEAFNSVTVRLNALHDLAYLLAAATRLDQVLDGILEAMGHLAGDGSAAIYLLDDDGGLLVPVRTRGPSFAELESIEYAMSAIRAAMDAGETVAMTSASDDLSAHLPGIRPGYLTVLATPLFAGGDFLGLLLVAGSGSEPPTEAEQEMLRTFSAQASVAVQTSRLFEEETESRRTAEVLQRVAQELVHPTSLRTALEAVESVLTGYFAGCDTRVVVRDPAAVGMQATSEEDARLLAAVDRVLGEGAVQPQGIEPGDVWSDAVLAELSCRIAVASPIAGGAKHGAILAIGLNEGRVSQRELDFVKAIADELALALENAYFFRRAVTRAENLETVFHISQTVGSSLQLNVVLNRVLDVVQKILSADAVTLMLYEPQRRLLTTTMGRGHLSGPVLSYDIEPGVDIPGQVFTRAEPVLLREMHVRMGGIAAKAFRGGLSTMLAVPLLARGRSIGVLMVFSADSSAFNDEEVNLLRTFASQASLAIDTARLYGRQHEIATVLEKSILPEQLPEFEELNAGSVYAPAGGDIDIGGDYYDLFRGPDGLIWIAIADVCGKGVYAATKTSMLKYVVRALAHAGYGPAKIISEANDMIAAADVASDIVTVWLGCYEPATATLRWADGGHPPGLLRRADGTIEVLEVTGPLLGAQVGMVYGEMSLRFQEGDSILLYTDGVTEARRGNDFFGEDRVRSVFAHEESPPETARSLLAAVRAHVDGDLRDDVAVLVVTSRVRPAGD